MVWRGNTPLDSGKQKCGRRKGKEWKGHSVCMWSSSAGVLQDGAHLVTLVMLPCGPQPPGFPSLPPPHFSVSSSLYYHSFCTSWALWSAPKASPVSEPGPGVGQLSKLPGPWGIQTREFSRLGPWKRRMSNNPPVTGIRFHQHSSNCVLCSPTPCPTVFSCVFSGMALGEGGRKG